MNKKGAGETNFILNFSYTCVDRNVSISILFNNIKTLN